MTNPNHGNNQSGPKAALADLFVASRLKISEPKSQGELIVRLAALPADTTSDQIKQAVSAILNELQKCLHLSPPGILVEVNAGIPSEDFEISIGQVTRFVGNFSTAWLDWWNDHPVAAWGGRLGPANQAPQGDPPWKPIDQISRAVEEVLWDDPGLLVTGKNGWQHPNDASTLDLTVSSELAIRELAARRLPLADSRTPSVGAIDSDGATELEQVEQLVSQVLPNKVLVRLGSILGNFLKSGNRAAELNRALSLMRDGLFYELGVAYGEIEFEVAHELPAVGYQVFVNNLARASGHILPREVFVNGTPEALKDSNPRVAINPENGTRGCWIDEDKLPKGFYVWNAGEFLVLQISSCLREAAREFADLAWAERILNLLRPWYPSLVEAVRSLYSDAQLANVFGRMVAEGISIRHLPRVLDRLLEFDELANSSVVLDEPGVSSEADWLRSNPVAVAEYLRSGLKDYITYNYTRGSSLNVLLLDAVTIEGELRPITRLRNDCAVYEFPLAPQFLRELRGALGKLRAAGNLPVLLTSSDLRPHLRRLIAAQFPRLAVLSYEELTPDSSIVPLDRLTFASN